MPDANDTLHRLMTRLAAIEKKARGISETALEETLRDQIATLVKFGQTRSEDLARLRGQSLAAVRADLKADSLDFKALLNDVRKTLAFSYLTKTDPSVTEITFSLGYSDCSIRTRACRKWFGRPHRDVRRRAA